MCRPGQYEKGGNYERSPRGACRVRYHARKRSGIQPLLHTLTGNIRFHRSFHSRHLPRDRDIIVYLPPDYDADHERRYPVFYLHDGQNLFDAETAFGGEEWHLDETAEQLIRAGSIQPLILIGIYNGEDRVEEYTPTTDEHNRIGGRAVLYAAMIIDELKPFVDSQYRTLAGPQNTALGGSSLGGLVTLYIGLRHPEIFGKLAALSPSLWWKRGVILRMIRDLPSPDPRPRSGWI